MLVGLISSTVVLVLLFKYLQKLMNFFKLINCSRTIPGPPLSELRYNTGTRTLQWFIALRHRYGPTFSVWFGKDLHVFVTDPDDIKAVLTSNSLLHKSGTYKLLQPWLGNGLLTNGGESWYNRRKLLTPAFHFKILETFRQPIADSCQILIEQLDELADERAVNIYPFITLCALDAISETAMGVKQHVQKRQKSDFVQATQIICKLMHQQSFSLWKRIPFLYNFTASRKERDNVLKVLHNETDRIIKLRKNLLEKSKMEIPDVDGDKNIRKPKKAFLDILLIWQKEWNALTDSNIREEVDTFMFEGHDTISSTIAFAIYLIANHPTIQSRLYEEITDLNAQENKSNFLMAVIKETLRLYPPVPNMGRLVTEEFKIGNLTIPPGAIVAVPSFVVHRNADIFSMPNKFIPERFMSGIDYPSFAYIPFSAGPRNCIGQKFAMLELMHTLSELVKYFEFLPVDGFKAIPVPELVLKSANGIYVRCRRRKETLWQNTKDIVEMKVYGRQER